MRGRYLAACLTIGLAAGVPAAQAQTSNITLRVATFGGHSGDVEQAYVGDRMTRMTGVKIEWTHGNPPDFVAKLLASRGREPPYDVVLLDDAVQAMAIKAGVLAKLDPAQVPNLQKLYPQMLNKQGYGPATLLYSVGLVFNKTKLKEAGIAEPTSWNDFWQPKLAGHIAVPDISLAQGSGFVIKIAQLAGGSEANVEPGLAKIAQLQANSYYTSSATLEQQLASGDVWMSVWTSGRGWAMADQGYPIGYVVPSEGSVAGIDTVDMVAGTPHPKEAQMFINMQLDPLSQMGWAEEMAYGPSNTTLQPVLAAYPDLAKKMPSSAADLVKLYRPDLEVYDANLKKAMDYWNRNVKH